jgi:hypothetical protein
LPQSAQVTTLIYVRYGSGEYHRCDARCYTAREPNCQCICKGANHGIGEAKAVQNVLAYTEKQVQAIAMKGGWVSEEIKQRKLL